MRTYSKSFSQYFSEDGFRQDNTSHVVITFSDTWAAERLRRRSCDWLKS